MATPKNAEKQASKSKAKKESPKDSLPEYLKTFAKAVEKEGADLDMKAVTLNAGERIRWAVSTGSLVTDLICGGGYSVGRYACPFGPEASGKTTGAMEAIASAIADGIVCAFYDSEGSFDIEYFSRILKKHCGLALEDVIAEIDENGNVKRPGLFYYIQPSSAENCFIHASRIAKALPDVVYSKKDGWCWQTIEGKNEVNTPREIGGRATAFFIIDSLKALVPQQQVENDQAGQMAQLAAALSNSFPKLTAWIGRKRIAVMYINQLRKNPGAKFGSPEYEPCGDSAKFYSSMRVRYSACALSTVDGDFFKTGVEVEDAKGVAEEEPSWDGTGIDRYRYAKIKTIKNKQFSPYQTAYVRYRYEKSSAPGDGIDPSFDVYGYLYLTGQCSKKTGKGVQISMYGEDIDMAFPPEVAALLGKEIGEPVQETGLTFDRKVTWREFKELVENPDRKKALVSMCRRQLDSGYAWALYFANKNAGAGDGED